MARSDPPRRSAELRKAAFGAEAGSPPSAELEVLSEASEALRPFLKDANEAQTAAREVVSVMRLHKGPLPPPELLGGYDQVLPGSAREIMDMALREQRHRHSVERAESRYPFWGMSAGFVAFVLCVFGAIYLAKLNQPVVAAMLVGTPLIGAIGWFINGRLQLKKAEPQAPVPQSKSSKQR